MECGIVKTSSVLIGSDQGRAVYRSLDAVPQPFRERILKSAKGGDCGTLLIADQGGRDYIQRVAARDDLPQKLEAVRERSPRPLWLWPAVLAVLAAAGTVVAFLRLR